MLCTGTRPGRFGKTLTMRMVEQFFSIRYAGRENLFENLSIWKEEKYRRLQGTYPVLFLSFANVKADNYKEAREGIIQEIADVYDQNVFLLNLDQEDEVRRWYDGFKIGTCSSIYNPWSITQFLDNREFKPYWADTSSNRLVTKFVLYIHG